MDSPARLPPPDRIIHVAAFLFFFFVVVVSHGFDWDYFYTTFETDLQAWVLDHSLPVWSYSFCAGSPRLADPQAFGLSPLFIIMLLAGPVLGAKLLFAGLAVAGYFGLRDLLASLTRVHPLLASYFSLYFVLGFYFFWHAHVGHVTFALIYLWLVAIALGVRLMQSTGLCIRRLVLLAVLVASGFTAGYYHSALFFLAPVAIILFPFLLALKNMRWRKAGILQALTAAGLGLALSSYKWIATIQHQLTHPRDLLVQASTSVVENHSLTETAAGLLLPTYHERYLGIAAHSGPYGIWEYSSYSWNHITLFLCLIMVVRFWRKIQPGVALMAIVLTMTGVMLALGAFASWAPFSLLNEYLLHDAMRGAGRFLIVASLGITLFQAAAISVVDHARMKLFLNVQRAGVMVMLLTPWAFYPGYQGPDWLSAFHYPRQIPLRQQALIWLPTDEANNPTTMYPVTGRGMGVVNCYSPLFQERRIQAGGEEILKQLPFNQAFHFVKTPPQTDEVTQRHCHDRSYFTSRRIYLDQSCPAGSCVFMNSIAPDDPARHQLELRDGLYCKAQTPSSERPQE